MNRILKGILTVGLVIGIASIAIARSTPPSIRVFDQQAVAGQATIVEVATSSAFNINGITTIGFDWLIQQATSTPHISIGYQTSMNGATFTATTIVASDTTTTDYTATDTAFTVAPTEWIRWILRTDLLNATGTKVSLWFKLKNEGEGKSGR